MSFRLKIGHWLLIFVAVVLPITATFVLYYPDERHYTDGAMYMLQHGDYLVPHTGAGAVRFEKPILAYWAVAASWLVLGVNALTARLPFLLACCGTLALTYQMARRFTNNAGTAILTVIILASQPQFLLSAARNIPDALLVFFVTLSAFGFLRILVLNETTAGAYWMAYGGAAGAALSKGLLGAGVVIYCWVFALLSQRDGTVAKKLRHWPSIMVSFLLVAGWFVYILAAHGTAAWGVFFGDQVTGNIHGHWWAPIIRVPTFALTVLVSFLPWTLTIIEGVWRQKKFSVGQLPASIRHFILIWTATLVVGFSLGSNISLRYVLPAAPLLAVLAADWLMAVDEAELFFSLRRVLAGVIVLFSLVCLLVPFMFYQWYAPMFFGVMGAGSFMAMLICFYAGAVWRNFFSRPEALGLAWLSIWLIFLLAAIPFVPTDSGIEVAASIKAVAAKPKPVLVVNNVQLANRLRIKLGREWPVMQAPKMDAGSFRNYKYLVVPQREAQVLADRHWQPQEIAVDPRVDNLRDLWTAIKTRSLPEYLDGHGIKTYLVIIP